MRKRRSVVDAVAGHRDNVALGLEPFDFRGLLVGKDFGTDFIDRKTPRNGKCRRAAIAGHHDHAQSVVLEVANCAGGRFLHRIGNPEQAGRLAVDHDEDNGLPIAAQTFGSVCQRVRLDVVLCQKSRATHCHNVPANSTLDSHAGLRLNCLSPAEREPLRTGALGDRCGQRMLTALLEAGSQSKPLGFIAAGSRNNRDDPRLALGKRASLVNHKSVNALQDLERLGVLDQNACGRSAAGGHHDRHRRR